MPLMFKISVVISECSKARKKLRFTMMLCSFTSLKLFITISCIVFIVITFLNPIQIKFIFYFGFFFWIKRNYIITFLYSAQNDCTCGSYDYGISSISANNFQNGASHFLIFLFFRLNTFRLERQ